LESALLRQIRELPEDSRRLLLIVAAERSGDASVIWRAADRMGIAGSALSPAETALRITEQITFRHSLVRAAVYAKADEQQRRDAHLALAGAMNPVVDWDRAAWHRAAATDGPDETVAADLETAADTAKARGGYGAAGDFLEFAARLTPDGPVRARRRLEAADFQLSAGRLQRAATLLAAATADPLGEPLRAQAYRMRARLAVVHGENGHTSGVLLEAAQALEPFDAAQAREAHLQALMAALFAGRLGPRDGVLNAARAARPAPRASEAEARAENLLLEGLRLRFADGPRRAAPLLRQAIRLIRDEGDSRTVGPAYHAALELWDEDALHALAHRRVELARADGGLVELPNALTQLGTFEMLVGRFDAADVCFEEAREVARATAGAGVLDVSEISAFALEAWRGREESTRRLARVCSREGTARGLGVLVGFAQYVLSLLELSLGNYRAALEAAHNACLDDLVVTRTLPELVEAAARSDEAGIAADAVTSLEQSAVASGSNWGLGMLARSRALIASDADAESLYRESIDHLTRCRVATQLARSRLVYGEWLRRMRRRRDARDQLRSAYELFRSMGAEAFALRASTELAATGPLRQRRRMRSEPIRALTPHERRIATLVGDGLSNADVASKLYISPRTVEYHLSKIYRKFDVSSRTQLARALLELDRDPGA
jgi:DNA-binding CsgD family transcriptional regulator